MSRLCVPHSSCHSAWQAPSPRRMNRRAPWTVLTCPKTGSMVRLRWAYQALPGWLSSVARMAARSPSLLDADGLPSLRGLPWRPARDGGISSCGQPGIWGLCVRLAIDQ